MFLKFLLAWSIKSNGVYVFESVRWKKEYKIYKREKS